MRLALCAVALMSQAQLLTLISVLFALLCAVVGFIVKGFRDQLQALAEKDVSAVLSTRMESIGADITKLEGRFEQRTKDKDRFDYEFRHGEYANAITSINTRLFPLEPRLNEHERRLNRLDAKIFNGHEIRP